MLEVRAGVRVAMSSTIPPSAKKRKQFSLSEKVDILREIEGGKKQAVVAKERGVARSTIATMSTDGERQRDEPAAEGSCSELWSEVTEQLDVDPSATFDDYVECDAATWTSAELTTDDILQSVQGTEAQDEDCSDDTGDDVTVAPEDRDESVSATDALDYLRKLRIFVEKSGRATEAVRKNADGLESFVMQNLCCCTRQKTITDYFK